MVAVVAGMSIIQSSMFFSDAHARPLRKATHRTRACNSSMPGM